MSVENDYSQSGDTPSIRKATSGDIQAVIDAITEAFDADLFVNWFIKNDEDRPKRLREFIEIAVRKLAMPADEVYISDKGVGAALWFPPGHWHLGWWDQLMLLPDMLRITGYNHLYSALAGLGELEKNHPELPHWYLMFIGVESRFRGQGIGSALLQTVLEICDKEHSPAYLETANELSVTLYERHGFTVTQQLVIPDEGPEMWLMWREPK